MKVRGDVGERLLRPREEPIDRGAVDEAGELLRAGRELGSDRREAEREVEVRSDALDEEGPQLVDRRLGALVHGLILLAALADDRIELVAREEVGQLAGVEEDVEILEEALLLDLLVGEHEDGREACTPARR